MNTKELFKKTAVVMADYANNNPTAGLLQSSVVVVIILWSLIAREDWPYIVKFGVLSAAIVCWLREYGSLQRKRGV